MEIVTTPGAPAAIGPYSQGCAAGGWIFVSGQLGADPVSGVLPEGIEAQAERACQNAGAVLSAAGAGFGHVLKTTCYLADMESFAAFNAVYAKYFTSLPARSCVAVKELPRGALCEIEAIAFK